MGHQTSAKLKVHNIDNLWVVDASIFPNITSGNINGPVMMMAYRASQLIINSLEAPKVVVLQNFKLSDRLI